MAGPQQIITGLANPLRVGNANSVTSGKPASNIEQDLKVVVRLAVGE
jgi:hypothetical protein